MTCIKCPFCGKNPCICSSDLKTSQFSIGKIDLENLTQSHILYALVVRVQALEKKIKELEDELL